MASYQVSQASEQRNIGARHPAANPESRPRNPGQFQKGSERARTAGQKGGRNSGGNFANDPQRAAEAGRKGGQASHGGGQGPQGPTPR